MRLAPALHAARLRSRKPAYWLVALGFPGVLLAGFFLNPQHVTAGGLAQAAGLLALWTTAVFLSPFPWQWTGDARLLARWPRGLLQALAFLLLAGMATGLLLAVSGKRPAHFIPHWAGISAAFSLILAFPLLPAGIVGSRLEGAEAEAREARERAREAQWMSHRGAFSPHLLFRNLNHLASTARADSLGTERGLLELAALYRQWLTEAEKPLVPFAAERELAEQYLALEQHRWGAELRARWILEPELDEGPVPPLILLPFLESALAGGPGRGPLHLEFHLEREGADRLLRLSARGPVALPDESALASLRQRLRSAFLQDGSVSAGVFPEGWELRIRLPLPAREVAP